MTTKRMKKILSGVMFGLFVFNQMFSYIPYFSLVPQVQASDVAPSKKNIVAILVDDKVYQDIKSEISRYAEYIQNTASNTVSNAQPLVLPINTQNISAPDIVKILEGLYFEGIKNTPSTLKGLIIIGDIPLPVVNDNGFIFPTIYPYIDFEEQKFIWNAKQRYFILNDNSNGQPEVFHGLIKYKTIAQYKGFFEKIKKYAKDPSKYTNKKIRYEDFIANKKYYMSEMQNAYLNNWLFAEDIGYHRYTELLLKIIQQINEGQIGEILEGLELPEGVDSKNIGLVNTMEKVNTMMMSKMLKKGMIKTYMELRSKKFLTQIRDNLAYSSRWIDEKKTKDGKVKTQTARDSHIKKTVIKDEFFTTYNSNANNFFVDLNNIMEKSINEKIEKEKYYMKVPLPLEYLDHKRIFKRYGIWPLKIDVTQWKKYSAYKNYYFGKSADRIQNAGETNIYRGTYRNLKSVDGLSFQDIKNSQNPSTDIEDLDLQKRSIGGSYDIFSQQVEANKGFNYIRVNKELDFFYKNRNYKRDARKMNCNGWRIFGFCIGYWRWGLKDDRKCNRSSVDDEEKKDCQDPQEFANNTRGGASALVMKPDTIGVNNANSPSKDKIGTNKYHSAILDIYDIAGSRKTDVALPSANNYTSLSTFANLVQRRFSNGGKYEYTKRGKYRGDSSEKQHAFKNWLGSPIIATNQMPYGNLKDNPAYYNIQPLGYSFVDYFDKYKQSEPSKEGNIIKLRNGGIKEGKIWTFKTIDSRIYNTNTLPEHIIGKTLESHDEKDKHANILFQHIEKIDKDIFSPIFSGIVAERISLEKVGKGVKRIEQYIKKIQNTNFEELSVKEYKKQVEQLSRWVNDFQLLRCQVENDIYLLKKDIIKTKSEIDKVNIGEVVKEMLYIAYGKKASGKIFMLKKKDVNSLKQKINALGQHAETIQTKIQEDIAQYNNIQNNLNNILSNYKSESSSWEDIISQKLQCKDKKYNWREPKNWLLCNAMRGIVGKIMVNGRKNIGKKLEVIPSYKLSSPLNIHTSEEPNNFLVTAESNLSLISGHLNTFSIKGFPVKEYEGTTNLSSYVERRRFVLSGSLTDFVTTGDLKIAKIKGNIKINVGTGISQDSFVAKPGVKDRIQYNNKGRHYTIDPYICEKKNSNSFLLISGVDKNNIKYNTGYPYFSTLDIFRKDNYGHVELISSSNIKNKLCYRNDEKFYYPSIGNIDLDGVLNDFKIEGEGDNFRLSGKINTFVIGGKISDMAREKLVKLNIATFDTDKNWIAKGIKYWRETLHGIVKKTIKKYYIDDKYLTNKIFAYESGIINKINKKYYLTKEKDKNNNDIYYDYYSENVVPNLKGTKIRKRTQVCSGELLSDGNIVNTRTIIDSYVKPLCNDKINDEKIIKLKNNINLLNPGTLEKVSEYCEDKNNVNDDWDLVYDLREYFQGKEVHKKTSSKICSGDNKINDRHYIRFGEYSKYYIGKTGDKDYYYGYHGTGNYFSGNKTPNTLDLKGTKIRKRTQVCSGDLLSDGNIVNTGTIIDSYVKPLCNYKINDNKIEGDGLRNNINVLNPGTLKKVSEYCEDKDNVINDWDLVYDLREHFQGKKVNKREPSCTGTEEIQNNIYFDHKSGIGVYTGIFWKTFPKKDINGYHIKGQLSTDKYIPEIEDKKMVYGESNKISIISKDNDVKVIKEKDRYIEKGEAEKSQKNTCTIPEVSEDEMNNKDKILKQKNRKCSGGYKIQVKGFNKGFLIPCDGRDPLTKKAEQFTKDIKEQEKKLLGLFIPSEPIVPIKEPLSWSDAMFLMMGKAVKEVADNVVIPGEQMNFTTSDRPIDSPRYITFQGVGGDVVKLIYPDLYKVEVFKKQGDLLILKSPEEIEQSIKAYLHQVTRKYNNYLSIQRKKKNKFYSDSKKAFDTLATIDFLSTPNASNQVRPYQLLSEDFLVKILENGIYRSKTIQLKKGMKPLRLIAHMLYQQNIPWEKRMSSNKIAEDIMMTIKSFDVNRKISSIVNMYLKQDNDQGNMITPKYQNNGYEVAYINSDGDDYIRKEEESSGGGIFASFEKMKSEYQKLAIPVRYDDLYNGISQEIVDECSSATDGELIFDISKGGSPRFKAFQCWLKKTKESPLSLEFDWSKSEGVPISSAIDQVEDEIEKTKTKWDALNTETKNRKTLEIASPQDTQILNEIQAYVRTQLSDTSFTVDGGKIFLKVSSIKKIGNGTIQMNLSSTGDVKLSFKEVETSKEKKNFTFAPDKGKKVEILMNPTQSRIGYSVLVIDLCTKSGGVCIKRSMKINLIPGEVKKVGFEKRIKKVLAGSINALGIYGHDKKKNNVGQLINENYNISVENGKIGVKNPVAKQIEFNDFRNKTISYQAPNSQKIITETIHIEGLHDKKKKDSYQIQVIPGKVNFLMNSVKGDTKRPSPSIGFELEEIANYLEGDSYGVLQINEKKLPMLELAITDNTGKVIPTTTMVSVKTKNSIINPGKIANLPKVIRQKQQNKIVKKTIQRKVFKRTTKFMIKDGILKIPFMPSLVAGKDVIKIDIPGVVEYEIPVEIYSGKPVQVSAILSKKDIQLGEKMTVLLTIKDKWGNILSPHQEIIEKYSGIKRIDKKVIGKNIELTLTTEKETGGVGYIGILLKDGGTLQSPVMEKVQIAKSYVPLENINVMYLNMFGSDWGNQWGYFSKNKNRIPEIMSKSKKLLATTTMLVSPEKIKKNVFLLGERGQIQSKIQGIEIKTNGNMLLYKIPNVGEVQYRPTTLALVLLTGNNKYEMEGVKKEEVLYYSPTLFDSTVTQNEIKNGSIIVNRETVIAIKGNKLVLAPNSRIVFEKNQYGYAIFALELEQKKVGELLLVTDSNKRKANVGANYKIDTAWINGSTNGEQGVGIYDLTSIYSPKAEYVTIQDSIDPKKGVGFTAPFKNISNFAGGMSVGESTIPFASEFLINFGDPFVKRISKNPTMRVVKDGNTKETNYDGGIGEIIKSFPGKNITQTLVADIDKDGRDDIVVGFSDGSIRLLKKYDGHRNYQDMGNIIVTSAGIKKIYLGDVNGNKYPDIILHTQSDYFLVYPNIDGKIAIDGYPICLNTNIGAGKKTKTPQKLEVHQLFVQDMDRDGQLDIVTHDKMGYLKIFYGGKDSFLSKQANICDDNWYERVKKQTKVLKVFGLKLEQENEIIDTSIVRRKGLGAKDKGDTSNVNPEELGINMKAIDSFLVKNKGSKKAPDANAISAMLEQNMRFDTSKAVDKYTENVRNILKNPLGFQPKYETAKDVGYLRLTDLREKDPIVVYKKYKNASREENETKILKNGDKIWVTVTMKAKEDFVGTFMDNIVGPRKIITSEDGGISQFAFGDSLKEKDQKEMNVRWDISNGKYTVDNIHIKKGKTITWKYQMEYQDRSSPVTVIVKDINGASYKKIDPNLKRYRLDRLPDIVLSPTDGCLAKQEILFNNHKSSNNRNNREYDDINIDLQAFYEKQSQEANKKLQEDTDKVMGDATKNLSDGNYDAVPGINNLEGWKNAIGVAMGDLQKKNTRSNTIENGGVDLSNVADAANAIIDGMIGGTVDKVDDFLQNMCAGFANGGKGLPVPFNQAFMGPGKYHVFGCYEIPPLSRTLGKGMPVLTFPGNWGPILGAYIPAPGIFGFPFKGPGDNFFLGTTGGPYPSMFRLYLMPTLTGKLGIGICGGSYSVGANIPSPIADMGGNCVVTAVGLGGGDGDDEKNKNNNNPDVNTNVSEEGYLANTSICERITPPTLKSFQKMTPFKLVRNERGFSEVESLSNADSLWGAAFIDELPTSESKLKNIVMDFPMIKLSGGTKRKNKIGDSNGGGIFKKLIKDWMDRQTRYIVNNLTKMRIDIILPEFGEMFEGFNTLKHGRNSVQPERNRARCVDVGGTWNRRSQVCTISPQTECKNEGGKWNGSACVDNSSGIGKLRGLVRGMNKAKGLLQKGNDYLNISEKIEDAFKEVKVINITAENINIALPMITPEAIVSYVSTAKAWGKTQEKKMEEWEAFVNYFVKECSDEENKDKDICDKSDETIKKILDFRSELAQIIAKVRKNVNTLQEYKKLPGQLYDMIHVQDRYLSEISSVINGFIGTLGMWMKTNASRISGYIDALITIITTLETYQILIDFPLEWKQKCGSCSQDAYDQYSCKLSMLCSFNLPIIPIPPFKIPNLKIDLSHFNIGLDITLPKFNFIPHKIPLPKLPDIPSPPQGGLEFKLKLDINIPEIPQPPQLPELPSFLPTIKLKLPVLPPAPKIPKLPNKITSTIKIAKKLGKIMCLVKNFSLVAEGSLKAKVEQMTQRTYEIPLWDSIDFTQELSDASSFVTDVTKAGERDAPLQGFDIGITSYVDLQYNFTPIFETIRKLADELNKETQKIENAMEEGINETSKAANQITEDMQDGINKPLALGEYYKMKENNTVLKNFEEQLKYTLQDYSLEKSQNVRKNLKNGLNNIREVTTNISTKNEVENILSTLDDERVVKQQNLDSVRAVASETVEQYRQNLNTIALDIKNNYQDFYESLKVRQPVSENLDMTLKTQMFTLSSKNPRYFSSAKTPSSISKNLQVNTVKRGVGIFVPYGIDGDIVNAVKSLKYASEIKNRYVMLDVNDDEKDDILLRNNDTIFVKYHKNTEETQQKGEGMLVYPIVSQQQLKKIANSYVDIGGKDIKLYSTKYEVKNFIARGQDPSSITVQWDVLPYQRNMAAGYLIKMNNKIENFFEKEYKYKARERFNKEYILVLPEGVFTGDKKVELSEKNDTIGALMTGFIVDIKRYNPLEEQIAIKIPLQVKEWKYVQVTALSLVDGVYHPYASYSNQVTAGPEALSDDAGPDFVGVLERKTTHQIITGVELKGYVGTDYNFNISLHDDTELGAIRVYDDKNLAIFEKKLSGKDDMLTIRQLFFTGIQEKKYKVEAIDTRGNVSQGDIAITVEKPEIEITSIVKNKDKTKERADGIIPTRIIATLTQDIDKGIVNFFNKRRARKIIDGVKDYIVTPMKKVIVSGVYHLSNYIGFKNESDEIIARMDPKNGKVWIVGKYKLLYDIHLKFETGGPVLQIRNIKDKKIKFEAKLPSEELISIDEGILEKVKLLDESFGKFRGGRALKKGNTIYMYVSLAGEIVVVEDLEGEYQYDLKNKTVKYYFSNAEKNISKGYIEVKIRNVKEELTYE